jgi:FkbM family methyltransferase
MMKGIVNFISVHATRIFDQLTIPKQILPCAYKVIDPLKVTFGPKEPERICKELYPKFINREDVVIEIGTLFGGDTMLLTTLVKFVYAFEASKQNFNRTKRVLRKRKNVKIYNYAVSDRTGTAILRSVDFGGGSRSIKEVQGLLNGKTETVKTINLDSIRFNLKPTVLVMDCERAEVDVLRGAKRLVPSLRAILVEPHIMLN